jgi:predicted nucleotidyltransferase
MIAEIQNTIAAEKDEIRRRYKAEIKGIFGSYARGDFHADSDLDLLVDFDEGANLFDLVGLQQFLEEKLDCKVDLVSRRSLREELRTSILNEMINL